MGCVLLVTMSTQAGAEPGPSGVDYTRSVTCATNSVNVKAVASASTQSGATFNQLASNGSVNLGTSANTTFAAGVTKIATFFQHAALDATAFVLNDFSDTTGLAPIGLPSFTFSPHCPETSYQESGSSTYRTIAPTRVLDTRPESLKNYAGGKPAANSQVPVRTDLAISATATAVAVNITIVDATSAGYVQAFPTGNGAVGASSNLNAERAGQIIANAAVLPVGADKTITLYTQAGAHLVVDVMGYFDAATSTGRYVGKASPERVLDTRPDSLTNYAGAKPAAGSIV